MIRILVVTDVRLYRDGLVQHLGRQPPMQVVGAAGDRASALEASQTLLPDVVLLDLAMAEGRATIGALRALAPSVRVVVLGVFELPYGLQLSPVFQAASARPYNLTAGSDLNADGNNNDRYIDPSTGKQVSLNAGRGDPTAVLDLRTTKFFNLGSERRVGVFAEVFNLLNTVNFGSSYTGNARSATFRQPTGFIPGIGYPRQLQIGARFLF